jgi:3-methyl-2-oxobutanoate hydroxymethyltransferase
VERSLIESALAGTVRISVASRSAAPPLECVPSKLAAEITAAIEIPTIGIGAGLDCDGQVLVLHDLIGLSIDRIPRFVRSYADTKGTILDAVTSWRQDVESKKFPTESETLA